MPDLLRVALYIRVSSEEQVQHGLSLEAQTAALTKWAKENDCEIVGTYIDGGKTARKALSRRLELQRLLGDVRENKIDLIIFTKFDRWTRNVKDYYKIQEVLDAHKVDWKAIFENYDTSTASGRLHINIMLSISQDEADRTSERIKAVFDCKLAKGEATCPMLPIGYKLEHSKIVIDDERRQIATDLFDYYYLYQSYRKAAGAVTENHGIYLHHCTIKKMLTNPIYIGTYRGREGFCEPLVERGKFFEIQDIVKSRSIKATPSQYDFIFTGLLVCSECGRKMSGNAQYRTYSGGRQGWYALYRCNGHYDIGDCGRNQAVGERTLETYLMDNIVDELNKYVAAYELSAAAPPKPKINRAEILRKMDKLKDLYLNDLIDIEIYKRDYAELGDKLKAADEQPREKKRNLAPLKDFLHSDFREIYNDLSNEEKRIMWRKIIKRLVIGADNKINIEFTN